MLVKLRENIFIADKVVTTKQLLAEGVSVILVVGDADISTKIDADKFEMFFVKLSLPESGRINKPHVKDIACHIPKYMAQNGETTAIIGETGLRRAAFVAARAICELESKSIYEIFVEIKTQLEAFDIGKAYL